MCFSEANIQQLLLTLNDIIKSSDKNVCTKALWVLSKQTFPTEVISKMVSTGALELYANKTVLPHLIRVYLFCRLGIQYY